ncbi:MAG: family 20 glycosylhydrolase [Clostridia bacterium]|nr:family 20 glycosylhydrolase [Clostridia bacterium]
MYVGYEKNAKFEHYRVGTHIPCPPEITESGEWKWSWELLLNTGLDLVITLPTEEYVGSVTLPLGEGSKIVGFEVFASDRSVGKYMAETGKTVSGKITAPVGVIASRLTVRVYTTISSFIVGDIEIAVAREDGAPLIWPVPKHATFGEGYVKLGKIVTENGAEEETCAARFLEQRLSERFGAIPEGDTKVTLKLDTGAAYEGERLTVEVRDDGITLTAGCRLSLMRAVCVLLSVGDADGFRKCSIDDKPDKPMRGFHMGLPKRDNIEFVKRLFRYILLPLGYNQLMVQFCGGMRYDSHPEITEAWLRGNEEARAGRAPTFPHDYMGAEGTVLEKDEVRDLLGYARELGFEIIPEVQSLGHVQYITYAHPELAEKEEQDKEVKDVRAEDIRPSNYYSHCYCPSDERCYALIFDLMDEIIEVAKPERYIHIGHDEVYHISLCKKCKKKAPHILFAEDVARMNERVKSLGYKTMMWADMIEPLTVIKHSTPDAAPLLPKDILMIDFVWYFRFDMNTEETIFPFGYQVIAGNLYSSHYPRYRERIRKMDGGQVSIWCALNEHKMASRGKFWDATYTAQLLSNPESYDTNLREVYSYAIEKYIQPLQRDEIRGTYSPAGYVKTDIPLPSGDNTKIPEALLAKRPSAIAAKDISVRIDGRYDRLLIENATLHVGPRFTWLDLVTVGEYKISYSDGTEETVPVEYAGNVHHLGAKYGAPLPEAYHRHYGYVGTWFSDLTLSEKNERGEDITLTSFVFENPHPEKEIRALSYTPREDDFTEVIIASVKGANKI